MTDNEIIKALECCGQNIMYEHCINCPLNGDLSRAICTIYLSRASLDLISRQKAEIERLEKHTEMYHELRAEAVKEFAERLKETGARNNAGLIIFVESDIDNLVKEMVGDG